MRPYREGGWGWMVALGSAASIAIVTGNIKAYGVLLTVMKNDFDTDLWILGSIGALLVAMDFGMRPFASAIARKVGGRPVILIGSTLYALGFVLSSVSYNVGTLAVSLVLLSGIGSACIIDIIRAEMAFYFHERYALPCFLSYLGNPVGLMVYGPVAQTLTEVFGWRGTMLLLGGMSFNLVAVGLLSRRPTGVYAIVRSTDAAARSLEETPSSGHLSAAALGRALVSALGCDVLLSVQFWVLSAAKICCTVVVAGTLIYTVPSGIAAGLEPRQAALMTAAFGAGTLVGLALAGAAASLRKDFPLHAFTAFAAFAAAVAFGVQPYLRSPGGLMVNTALIGAGTSWGIFVMAYLVRYLPFADDKFVFVLGWQGFLGGIVIAFADTLTGWLYDASGTFHLTFFLYSAIMVASGLCVLVDLACK